MPRCLAVSAVSVVSAPPLARVSGGGARDSGGGAVARRGLLGFKCSRGPKPGASGRQRFSGSSGGQPPHSATTSPVSPEHGVSQYDSHWASAPTWACSSPTAINSNARSIVAGIRRHFSYAHARRESAALLSPGRLNLTARKPSILCQTAPVQHKRAERGHNQSPAPFSGPRSISYSSKGVRP